MSASSSSKQAALRSQTSVSALAIATDVMTGGAIIALGVTLYVGLRTPSPAAPAKSAMMTGSPKPPPAQLRFGVTGNGVRFIGSF